MKVESEPVCDGQIHTINGHYWSYHRNDARFVDIETVAHSLSNLCRFTGHSVDFYCVAQHCVLMSYYAVPPQHALWALLHEAGEPMCGDVNKPLKELLLPSYDRIEGAAQRAILLKLGMDPDSVPSSIKPADHVLLATEQRDLMPKRRAIGWDEFGLANRWEPLPEQRWYKLRGVKPLDRKIYPWVPAQARAAFLNRYLELAFSPAVEQEGTLAWSAKQRGLVKSAA